MPQRMTREEFYRWAEAQPKGRYERVDGMVVAMAPERAVHVQIKNQVWRALDDAVRAARLGCQAFGDGLAVAIDDDTDYQPDALVNCGPPLDLETMVAPNPVVVVEVLSRSTQSVDVGEKFAGYFRVPAVQHYLIVQARRRGVIHHRRVGDRIESRILTGGEIALDPPGIAVTVEEFYTDLPL